MPAKTGSRNGLSYGWSLGENNWNVDMDGNLSFIDRFGIHLSFKSFLNTPPGSPADGDSYVVGAAPAGAWVGKAGQVAVYDDGAWFYGVPRTGWQAYCEADGGRYVFDVTWTLPTAVTRSTAASGSTINLTTTTSHLLYDNAATAAALTVNLPSTGMTDGMPVTIATRSAITALTIGGGTIYGIPTTLPAGGFCAFIYSIAGAAWFRKG